MQKIYINATNNYVLRSSVLMCIVLYGEAPWSGGGGWSLDEYFDFLFMKFFFSFNEYPISTCCPFDFVSTMPTEFIQTHASLKSITPQRNLPVKSH